MITSWLTRCRMLLLLIAAIGMGGGGLPQSAEAHYSSIGYSDITVDGRSIRFDLYLPADLMGQLIELDLNRNGRLENDEAIASKEMLREYASDYLKVTGGDTVGKPVVTEASFVERGSHLMLRILLDYIFSEPVTAYAIEYKVFYDGFDPGHQNIALLTADGEQREIVFDQTKQTFRATVFTPSGATNKVPVSVPSWVLTGWTYVKMGIEHILSGYDHLLFLLGILLAGGTLKRYVKLLTAFTVGHSLTLALSVTEILTVPIGIVEPLIAVSLVYIAIENVWKRSIEWRPVITLLFGLVHGLGFADLLRGKLGADLSLPLISFNVGVELGQLLVVLLIVPILGFLRARQLQSLVNWSLSGAIALFGTYWFFERIL